MRIRLKNELSQMAVLRQTIQDFARDHHLNEDIIFMLDLCLEELVTNVIVHGTRDGLEHQIEIFLSFENSVVLAQVKDDGIAFDPTQAPVPDLDAPLEKRRIGGLGIHLVRHYVDSMEYMRDGEFNIVTLKKQV